MFVKTCFFPPLCFPCSLCPTVQCGGMAAGRPLALHWPLQLFPPFKISRQMEGSACACTDMFYIRFWEFLSSKTSFNFRLNKSSPSGRNFCQEENVLSLLRPFKLIFLFIFWWFEWTNLHLAHIVVCGYIKMLLITILKTILWLKSYINDVEVIAYLIPSMCVSLLGYLSVNNYIVNVSRLQFPQVFRLQCLHRLWKMVVNVKIGDKNHNLSELLDWLNDILQATFSQVEHTCSGIFFYQVNWKLWMLDIFR